MFTYVVDVARYISFDFQHAKWATFYHWPNPKGWHNWWQLFAQLAAVHSNLNEISKMYWLFNTHIHIIRFYILILYFAGSKHEFGQIWWTRCTYQGHFICRNTQSNGMLLLWKCQQNRVGYKLDFIFAVAWIDSFPSISQQIERKKAIWFLTALSIYFGECW